MSIYDVDGNQIAESVSSAISVVGSFGAVGDGTTDDTSAIQSAVNNKGLLVFETGKTYRVTSTIRIPKNVVIDLNGSTIVSEYKHLFFNFLSTDTSFTGYNGNGNITIKNGTIVGGAISFAHGENIVIDNVQFKNSINDHFLEIAGCKAYSIRNCSFVGMENLNTSVLEYINIDPCVYGNFPWVSNGSAFYDNTVNDGIYIRNCKFSLGSGTYAYGYNAVGVHSTGGVSAKHTNINIVGNDIKGFTGCGLRINMMNGVFIDENNIQTVGNGIVLGDVSDCENIVIKDNYVVSSNGSKLVKTNGRYTNLTVVGNKTAGTIEDF